MPDFTYKPKRFKVIVCKYINGIVEATYWDTHTDGDDNWQLTECNRVFDWGNYWNA